MKTLANNDYWEEFRTALSEWNEDSMQLADEEFNGWVQLGGDPSRCPQDFIDYNMVPDIVQTYEEEARRLGPVFRGLRIGCAPSVPYYSLKFKEAA